MSNTSRAHNPGPPRGQPAPPRGQPGPPRGQPGPTRVDQGRGRGRGKMTTTPTVNLIVSFFQSITSLQIPEQNIAALQLRFGAYKYLPPGANNFGQALIISIFDCSIINSTTDIISSMYQLFSSNYYLMLPESDKQLEIISMIYNIVIKQATIEEKLEETHKIYNDMNNEISLLFRNCLFIIIKQRFYSKKYEIQQSINTQEGMLSHAANITAQPNIEDFVFITDYFDINLRILYEQSLQLTLFGTGVKYPIYLFESSKGYFPIYTLEDCQMRTLRYEEVNEMSAFIKHMTEAEYKEADRELYYMNEEILRAKEESNALIEIYSNLNSYANPTLVCDEAVKNCGPCDSIDKIKNVLEEFSCSYCKRLTKIGVLDCEHRFCVNCVGLKGYSNDNRLICSICDYLTDYMKVIHLWNQ